jgi:hypothetical protein
MVTVSLLLVFLPIAMSGTIFAQTAGYTITQVNHQIQVLYTGQVVIQDTIQVSGQVTNGFMIGLPAQYSNDILSAVAYDSNSVFQVNLGVQLGSRSGFYGAKVNFNGQTPSVFTVAFVLSNSLITQKDTGDFTLNFPAYPSLTQDVGSCNVTLTFPSTPRIITVTKSDGDVDTENYAAQNLPAYTYSPGSAAVQVTNETIQLADVTHLNREITIGPTGQVSASDTYTIINNSTYTMTSFILDVPTSASNVVVKDETGTVLSIGSSPASTNVLQKNATLVTPVSTGQSAIMTVSYNLPSATIQGSQYTLSSFNLFPDFKCYVEQASLTFNPPEGATIITPKLSSLGSSSTLTRSAFQDTLTIIKDGISNIDYSLPQSNTIQLSYTYNPIWVSFMPTLWLSLVAVIGCVGAVIYQKRKPGEKERAVTRKATVSTPKPTAAASAEQVKSAETRTAAATGQRITGESIREFTDSYENKKRLNTEMRSLDIRAQKGKIPRRQYKVQRRAIEVRLETLSRNTTRMKETLRSQGSAYSDLIKQLDSAEEDLAEAEDNIKNLEDQQSRGEISIEAYKRTIGDYQKRRDKAESALNGILLRLREKAR